MSVNKSGFFGSSTRYVVDKVPNKIDVIDNTVQKSIEDICKNQITNSNLNLESIENIADVHDLTILYNFYLSSTNTLLSFGSNGSGVAFSKIKEFEVVSGVLDLTGEILEWTSCICLGERVIKIQERISEAKALIAKFNQILKLNLDNVNDPKSQEYFKVVKQFEVTIKVLEESLLYDKLDLAFSSIKQATSSASLASSLIPGDDFVGIVPMLGAIKGGLGAIMSSIKLYEAVKNLFLQTEIKARCDLKNHSIEVIEVSDVVDELKKASPINETALRINNLKKDIPTLIQKKHEMERSFINFKVAEPAIWIPFYIGTGLLSLGIGIAFIVGSASLPVVGWVALGIAIATGVLTLIMAVTSHSMILIDKPQLFLATWWGGVYGRMLLDKFILILLEYFESEHAKTVREWVKVHHDRLEVGGINDLERYSKGSNFLTKESFVEALKGLSPKEENDLLDSIRDLLDLVDISELLKFLGSDTQTYTHLLKVQRELGKK